MNRIYFKRYKSIFLFFLILNNVILLAQESKVKINEEGKDFNHLKHTWTAQWITHPTESTLDSRLFLFRNNFDLTKLPGKFKIHLSADNRYRLYINGVYILSGPSSSDILNYRYETIDIAKYLKTGKNTIAAEVVNFGEYRKVSTMTFQTAFILQGDETNVVDVNTSRKSDWKVIRDFGFESIPFVSDSLRGYYAAGPGEKRIEARHPKNWKKTNFDDSNWLNPKSATVEFAVGKGFLFGSTWHLVPRTIPFLEESKQQFGRIARSKGMLVNDDFIKGRGPLTIPPNLKVSILIDQEHHTIGHPEMIYSKGKNSEIKITYSEAMYDENWKKGNRNDVTDKRILGYYDIIQPDGTIQNFFKPFGQKTYRYIQLDIKTKDEALVIDDYYGVYTAYPFKENAKFETGIPILDQIWDASWLTLRNSSVEGFIDPYYEQLQYIGDTRIEALVSITVDGDDRLMRKAIEMFDNSRLPNGLTQSRYPSYIVQIIPTYSLIWIEMLYDYHMYKNDDEFVKRFIPGMKTVLEWWMNKVDETGMPTDMEWWNFTDWSTGFHNGIPDGADDGYSASIALQTVYALQNAVTIFKDFKMDHEADLYDALQKKIIKSVLDNCYDSKKGLIAETPNKNNYSQHTNIMAILTNAFLATPAGRPERNQKNLMQKILDDKSLIQTTIYYKFYLFNALQKAGLGDMYLDLLKNWTNQLDLGLTTFAETDIDPRSECHAWSASPNFHFLTLVAGIQPKSKNFKEIIIAPNMGELKYIDAKMPHPNGFIELKLERDGKRIKGNVTLPEGSKGVFSWHEKRIDLKEGNQSIDI